MAYALINDYAAVEAEVDPVHDFLADRAFEITDIPMVVGPSLRKVGQFPVVDGEDLADRAVQKGLDLAGIEEETVTAVAVFDQKGRIDTEIDGLERLLAVGTDAFRQGLVHRIADAAHEIDIVFGAAVGTTIAIGGQRGGATGATRHGQDLIWFRELRGFLSSWPRIRRR